MNPLESNFFCSITNQIIQNPASVSYIKKNLDAVRSDVINGNLEKAKNRLNNLRGFDLQSALRLELHRFKDQCGEKKRISLSKIQNPRLRELVSFYLQNEPSIIESNSSSSSTKNNDLVCKEDASFIYESESLLSKPDRPMFNFQIDRIGKEISPFPPIFDFSSIVKTDIPMSDFEFDRIVKKIRPLQPVFDFSSTVKTDRPMFNFQVDPIVKEINPLQPLFEVPSNSSCRNETEQDEEILNQLRSLIDANEPIDNDHLQSLKQKLTPKGRLKATEMLDSSSLYVVSFAMPDERTESLEISGQTYSLDSIEELLPKKNETIIAIETSLKKDDFEEAFALAMSIPEGTDKNQAFLQLIKHRAQCFDLDQISNLLGFMQAGKEKDEALYLIPTLASSMFGD